MLIADIYESVNLKVPLEEKRFIHYYNDTVSELGAYHPQFLFIDGYDDYDPITDINSECTLRPLYIPAVIDNIIFLSGADTTGTYKSEFLRKSDSAYCKYWHDHAKGSRIKKHIFGIEE